MSKQNVIQLDRLGCRLLECLVDSGCPSSFSILNLLEVFFQCFQTKK